MNKEDKEIKELEENLNKIEVKHLSFWWRIILLIIILAIAFTGYVLI